MAWMVQGVLTLLARILLATIFLMSALGNKIPNYNAVAEFMGSEGVPEPKVLLAGAIACLLLGGVSLVLGLYARVGAFLLLVFLLLATYYFHDFWTFADPKAQQEQMIQFLKNLGLMGGMLFIVANGPGPMSLDARRPRPAA